MTKPLTPPPSLEAFRKKRKPLRNVGKEIAEKLHWWDRLAIWITEKVGTLGFFGVIFVWTVVWLGWNLAAPAKLQFDPPMGFVLWLFISNLIQILLMPLIMVGQNIQGRHADARAENDLEINIKAEDEIEMILYHLEYQNQILIALMKKLDVDVAKAIEK